MRKGRGPEVLLKSISAFRDAVREEKTAKEAEKTSDREVGGNTEHQETSS